MLTVSGAVTAKPNDTLSMANGLCDFVNSKDKIMPVTMTWNLFSEKRPAHHEQIIWLQTTSAFDGWGYNPREICVEYCWVEMDDDGYANGISYIYEEGDTTPDNCELAILADGNAMEESDLWMNEDDYYAFLEANIPALKSSG